MGHIYSMTTWLHEINRHDAQSCHMYSLQSRLILTKNELKRGNAQ